MGQWCEIGGFEFVGGDEQFVEGGWWGGVGFFEYFWVDVELVYLVYVDWYCYVVVVVFYDLCYLFWQQVVLFVFGGYCVEVGEQVQFVLFLDIWFFDLCCGWWIVGYCVGFQYGYCCFVVIVGYGEVFLGVVFGFDQFFQGFGGVFFVGGGLLVQYFDFVGLGQQWGEIEGGKIDDGREVMDCIYEENFFFVIWSKFVFVMF